MPERPLAPVLPKHESAALFRLMVTDIRACGVMLTDPLGMITIWNKAAEEMTGYTSEQAIGAPSTSSTRCRRADAVFRWTISAAA